MDFISSAQIKSFHQRLYGDVRKHGWRIRLNHRFGFHPPDFWYELVVDELVTEQTRWIDVGGGKSMFPHNPRLAQELSKRCQYLLAVDPSSTVLQNQFADRTIVGMLDSVEGCELPFHLATLRMVAEHVEAPHELIEQLESLVSTGGHVVVLTPNRWSPNSLLASWIPNKYHPLIVSNIEGRHQEDVFPTQYKMNTRKDLQMVFEKFGFDEVCFLRAADCSITSKFKPLYFSELCLWKSLKLLGLGHPESNLLGVYRKRADI